MNIKILLKGLLSFFSFVVFIILFSCEEDPSPLGSSLLPDSDKIKFNYDTSLTFKGYVVEGKKIITSIQELYNLGEIDDLNFGQFKGMFAGQFIPASFGKNVEDFKIDSVVLILDVDSVYGDNRKDVKFNVFKLNKALEDSSGHTVYSDEEINIYPDEINKKYSPSDTVYRITLNDDFEKELKNIIKEDSTYFSKANFLKKFNGIAIIPERINNTSGGLYNINMLSEKTKIIMYYNDTLEFDYKFSTGFRYAQYVNDYSTSKLNTYLTNSEEENDDLLFLQGINGVNSKIKFTNIAPWIEEDSSYSILNAELSIPVLKDDNFVSFTPPENLILYYYTSDSNFYSIEDHNISQANFDGTYNEELNYYNFNISKHIMRMLKGDVKDSCLNITIYKKTNYPHRVILKSPENIKLKLTYTKH